MESSMFFGNACQNGVLPTLLRPTLPAFQPSLGMKHFLPFPLDTAVSLLPSLSAMDPVQKAVMHHTFGAAPSAKRRPVSCSVCQLRFNSQSQALAHYKGTKHAKKLKALEAPKCKLKGSVVSSPNPEISKSFNTLPVSYSTDRKATSPGTAPLSPMLTLAPPPASAPSALPAPASAPPTTTGRETTSAAAGGEERPSSRPATPPSEPDAGAELGAETEEEKARRLLYCSLCKVAVNSASQLEAHSSGTKHKTMLEARSGVGSIKSFPRPGVKSKLATPTKAVTGLQNKTFHCETCDVHVNSETQLKQHITSRRHKDRAAGKPSKPKYSPYSQAPRGPAHPPVKLTMGKELCQPMTAAQIVPAHLAAVAAAMGSAFSLRSAHPPGHAPGHSPALFQTQLLRPAPGPVRTAHTQILFTPY